MNEKVKKDLQWACRDLLLTQLKESTVLTESNACLLESYIKTEATYEQLLNHVVNPFDPEEVYLEASLLEEMVVQEAYEMIYGDKWKAMLYEADEETPKKKGSKLKTAAKAGAIGAGAAGIYTGYKVASPVVKLGVGAAKVAGAINNPKEYINKKSYNNILSDIKIAKAKLTNLKGPKLIAAKKRIASLSNQAKAAKKVWLSSQGFIKRGIRKGGKVGAGAAALYLIYRGLKGRGKSDSEAANAAANAAASKGDQVSAARWKAKAAKARTSGK